ncbi:hypothetical protein TNIN_77081 [Trichonephila inaurata madagascariensis]|uniref:Uncharacterized protein n=1 Tax=Trichonephila inaurata madagascariensis TaxID=2747483 RepID=A0A8X6XGN1_9ARAC|nr:hypothetical protein TNIN_77081 [Trichonephila inaurata madagascariensis]
MPGTSISRHLAIMLYNNTTWKKCWACSSAGSFQPNKAQTSYWQLFKPQMSTKRLNNERGNVVDLFTTSQELLQESTVCTAARDYSQELPSEDYNQELA